MAASLTARSVGPDQRTTLRLAWLSVSRRRKRTIVAVVLLASVMGSSITVSSAVVQMPGWTSTVSASLPNLLIAYQRNATFLGLLPVNSVVPNSDLPLIQGSSGVASATPIIIKYERTSISNSSSIVVGLDINFWQLGLGLSSGRWPQPNSTEAVVILSNGKGSAAPSVELNGSAFRVVGVARTSDLALDNSVVIPFGTAQRLFSLGRSASVFLIQTDPQVDTASIDGEITATDPGLATTSLSPSSQLAGAVSTVVAAISNSIVLVTALFALVIIAVLSILNLNDRRWEYGLVSVYGGRATALKAVLLEDWIVFGLAVPLAAALGTVIFAYFTYYFNSLAGSSINSFQAIATSVPAVLNLTTLVSLAGAFVAATLGSVLASKTVANRLVSDLLAEPHP